MLNLNKVEIAGNLGKDVEYKSKDKVQVARFYVASNEYFTDKETNQKKTKVQWHNIVVFNKLAEIANQYLHKGSAVYVQGKLSTRSYKDGDNKKYVTEIIAQKIQFLDKKVSDKKEQQSSKVETPESPPLPENTEVFTDDE